MELSPSSCFAASRNPFACPRHSSGRGQHLVDYSDEFISTIPLKLLAAGS